MIYSSLNRDFFTHSSPLGKLYLRLVRFVRGLHQFGSDDRQRFCRTNNLEPSMSRRGNCWDNAVAESFFSSLKNERVGKRIYKTRDLAKAEVFDHIEVFYNRTRRHSHLGGVSPEAFERASS
jgi:putative transposase